ncbi:MAG: hypothetical protein M1816_002295 [Peltula sp. TS41687]|nr:MAG: hypothetical protein M1816_002295 [Peltula sp. TS41687]
MSTTTGAEVIVVGASFGSPRTATMKNAGARDGSLPSTDMPGSSSPARDECMGERETTSPRPQIKEAKYNLYPKITPHTRSRTAPLPCNKPSENEKVLVETTETPTPTKRNRSVRHMLSSASRFRRKDSSASKSKDFRRDASPMTTVPEAAMDSPTIPGRYPVHERSNSAPGWGRQGISGDATETGQVSFKESPNAIRMTAWPVIHLSSPVKRKPVTPPKIEKLIIPKSDTAPWRMRTPSPGDLIIQSHTSAPAPPPKESPVEHSPGTKGSGTPNNLSSFSLTSSTAAGTPMTECEQPLGPGPWESTSTFGAGSPIACQRGLSETPTMQRCRTVKRRDDELCFPQSKSSTTNFSRTKASQTLPTGFKSVNASSHYPEEEILRLHEQALGQATKFEVLGVKDVEGLSKELRALDERCEYLHRCQLSLRSNRQTLHSRTIAYLQSPRLTQFSREDMLRQELALARLDHALDDYCSKMEQAENRRTRIRQKLLEHVAAALTLTPPPSASSPPLTNFLVGGGTPKASTTTETGIGVGVGLGVRVGFPRGIVVADLQGTTPPDTPESRPTSPSLLSSSSSRYLHSSPPKPTTTVNRKDVESIRIYADSNLYGALFTAMTTTTTTTEADMNSMILPSRSSSLEHYRCGNNTSHDENEIQIGVEIQEGAFLRIEENGS